MQLEDRASDEETIDSATTRRNATMRPRIFETGLREKKRFARGEGAPGVARYFVPAVAVRGASQGGGGGSAKTGPMASAPGGSAFGSWCFTGGMLRR